MFDDETDEHLEEWQEQWYADASKFLKAAAADDCKRKDTRKYRLSSWEWSVCLDNIFKVKHLWVACVVQRQTDAQTSSERACS